VEHFLRARLPIRALLTKLIARHYFAGLRSSEPLRENQKMNYQLLTDFDFVGADLPFNILFHRGHDVIQTCFRLENKGLSCPRPYAQTL